MGNLNRESSKAALGGMIAALSVVIMLITYFSNLFIYLAPEIAGLLLVVILEEMGMRWAFGTFAAISLLSLFIIADKEAAVYYTMFFGYYPIVRIFLSQKINSKAIILSLGCLIFNVAITAAILFCAFVLHIDYSEMYEKGKVFLVIFIVAMNIIFFGYDHLLVNAHILYREKIKKKVKKLFK